MDWQNIVTPVKIQVLTKMLKEANYNPKHIHHLSQGFTEGFDLGYRGPMKRHDTSDNLPFKIGDPTEMWNKIMKEVQLNRYAVPFESIPSSCYVQSPIGLVPKAGNKTRLIFHLSYDFKNKGGISKSINHHTDAELCSVRYRDLDHAVETCMHLLKKFEKVLHKPCLYFSKTDVISAFRILPIRPDQCFLLIMKARHPITK